MAKTANVFTRVDPKVKEEAERILEQLGIPMSSAIGMFLRQVVMQNGIPFEIKLPVSKPLSFGELTPEQFDKEIQKGYDDVRSGRIVSADQVEADLQRRYGI